MTGIWNELQKKQNLDIQKNHKKVSLRARH